VFFLTFMAHLSGAWIYGLFVSSLILAAVAQIIAYRSGERNCKRFTGMCCGIAAVFLMFAAGQIASAKLTNYVNSIGARSGGE
jgi:uncharacterized membrane protein